MGRSAAAVRGGRAAPARKLIADSYGVEPEIRHVEVAAVIEDAPATVA